MWNCKGCKNSCCISKKPALNKADVIRIFKVVGSKIFDYVQFRDDIKGRVVKGNKLKGVLTLKSKKDGSCIFYKNERCTIYNSRPRSCKLYPFNPIFTEQNGGFRVKIENNVCKELKKGHIFEYMPDALKWREERLEYDKIVEEWNNKKDRHLGKFIGELLT